MRISIKPHHKQYLELIAQQMGCDQVAAIDYLLWELRCQGYAFGSPLPSVLVHSPQVHTIEPPQPPPLGAFIRFEEVKPASVSTPMMEDELITRLIQSGLEEF